MKTCTKCLKRKRRDAFRRYWGRSSDGLRPLCRECQKKYEAFWRRKNAARLREKRCARREKEAAYRLEYDAKNRGRLLVMEAKRRSRKYGIAFDLDKYIPQIEQRILNGCEMTGHKFDLYAKGVAWNSPSLDRINPKGGYTYSNIRVICFGMNAALGSWGEAALREMLSGWFARRP